MSSHLYATHLGELGVPLARHTESYRLVYHTSFAMGILVNHMRGDAVEKHSGAQSCRKDYLSSNREKNFFNMGHVVVSRGCVTYIPSIRIIIHID